MKKKPEAKTLVTLSTNKTTKDNYKVYLFCSTEEPSRGPYSTMKKVVVRYPLVMNKSQKKETMKDHIPFVKTHPFSNVSWQRRPYLLHRETKD